MRWQQAAPTSIPMDGNKSVTRVFVTSKGLGKGGDLGDLGDLAVAKRALPGAGASARRG